MKDYRLGDLLDMGMLQKLADSNFSASGLPITIVDAVDMGLLVKAGWPEICDRFHRAHPVSAHRCRLSDAYVSGRLGQAESFQYKCRNGLWHIAIPIVVADRHLATLFLTQFFFDGERPDRGYFTRQALELGFDPDTYLRAIDAMPVFSAEKVEYILAYDKALVRFISDLALQSLRVIETKKSLSEGEENYHTLVNNVNIGVYRNSLDGRFIQVNPAMAEIFGFASVKQLMHVNDVELYRNPVDRLEFIDEIRRWGFVKDRELPMRKQDDTPIWCAITVTARYDDQGEILWLDSAMEDITERKQAREQLQRTNDQLELRVHERTAALAQINELLRVEIAERKRIEQELRTLSERDPLTGLLNRRTLYELLDFEVRKARRYDRPLSLLMFDLDHFKQVNDRYGHNVGDTVLKSVVQIVTEVIRQTDSFARYGGEEFIIFSPEIGLAGALALAEKIRAAVEGHLFTVTGRLTVSIGVAELSGNETDTALINRADAALYAAKKRGRNRVETAVGCASS